MILLPSARSLSLPRLRAGGLSDRIIAAVVPHVGHPYDAASKAAPGQFTTFGARPVVQGSAKGAAITASGGGLLLSNPRLNMIEYSFFMECRITGIDSPWGGLFCISSGTGAATYSGLQRNNATADMSIFHAGGGSASVSGLVTDLADSEWHTVAICCAAGGTSVAVYLDGYLRNTVTVSTALAGVTDARLVLFGERTGSASYNSDGQIRGFYAFDKVLSAVEVRELHADHRAYVFEDDVLFLDHMAASGAYSLAADAGSCAVTGQAADLRATRILAGDAGTFTHTGQAADLRATRTVAGDAGTFTFTGQDAGLIHGTPGAYTLAAAAGSFAAAGQDARLRADRTLAGDTNTITHTGQAVNLTAQRLLAGGVGPFVLTGQAAQLSYSGAVGGTLTAAGAAFALTGGAAAFTLGTAVRGRAIAGRAFELRPTSETRPPARDSRGRPAQR